MTRSNRAPYEKIVFVCCNQREPGRDSCGPRGAEALLERRKRAIRENGLYSRVRVSRALCRGLCSIGPNLTIQPDNIGFHGVTEQDLAEVLRLSRPQSGS